jgi:hypothetical protein
LIGKIKFTEEPQMKKRTKVFTVILMACIFITMAPIQGVMANRLGDVLGYVLNTDIRVFINGVEINIRGSGGFKRIRL